MEFQTVGCGCLAVSGRYNSFSSVRRPWYSLVSSNVYYNSPRLLKTSRRKRFGRLHLRFSQGHITSAISRIILWEEKGSPFLPFFIVPNRPDLLSRGVQTRSIVFPFLFTGLMIFFFFFTRATERKKVSDWSPDTCLLLVCRLLMAPACVAGALHLILITVKRGSERARAAALCVCVVNLDKWNNLLMVSQSLALKDK